MFDCKRLCLSTIFLSFLSGSQIPNNKHGVRFAIIERILTCLCSALLTLVYVLQLYLLFYQYIVLNDIMNPYNEYYM